MTAAEDTPDVSVTNDLSFLWLEITAKCNLLCTHCYADSGPRGDLHGNMTYSDWTRVIDEAAELGCPSVQFIGGEPTIHPRLADLVDHANHRSSSSSKSRPTPRGSATRWWAASNGAEFI
jgi:MoaA/NifB/PqqE/SkfB family radical SAM enzyme